MVTTAAQKSQSLPPLLQSYTDSAKDSRVGVSQLPWMQQMLAQLFMMFVENDDSSDDIKNQTEEQAEREHGFATALGYDDNAKGVSDYRNWRGEMKKNNWNWQEKTDFSGVVKKGWSGIEKITGCTLEVGERQKQVMSIMKDAASTAGVSAGMMQGIWGVESHFGRSLTSPTGCKGDWQFTQGSFAGEIKTHGDEIANRLLATGNSNEASMVKHYADGLRNGSINAHDNSLQDLRNNAKVSTYAAAFLMKDNAQQIGVDAQQQSSWGLIYASYNIGAGNARKLATELRDTGNTKGALGFVAAVNPQFFKDGATGAQALGKYQATVEAISHSFDKGVGAPSQSAQPVFTAAAQGLSATEALKTKIGDRLSVAAQKLEAAVFA